MRVVLFLAFTACLHAEALFEQCSFPADASGWKVWSQRAETAPRSWVDTTTSRGADANSLALSGGSNTAAYGGWQHSVTGVLPGTWYRLTAWYRATALENEALHALARIDWRKDGNRRAGQPDYGVRTIATAGSEWRQVQIEAPAPEGASSATIQLFLGHAPQATIWWDDVRFEKIQAPHRPVRVASVRFRPRGAKSVAENVQRFIEQTEKTVGEADLIILPEAMTIAGTGINYVNGSEPVPGPTTKALGEMAKLKHAWVVAGLMERDGTAVYNTAVLLNRNGELAGRYRKVYLPREEIEGGLTPGDGYPVFQTDFGRLGLMICWDVQYADPARMLALSGAELIAMPIAGGNRILGQARAIENQVFLISSGYDYPTEIIDPKGELLARAEENPGIAQAVIDLGRRYDDPWLGNMRERMLHEIRTDITHPRP